MFTRVAHGGNINGEATYISFSVPGALGTYPMGSTPGVLCRFVVRSFEDKWLTPSRQTMRVWSTHFLQQGREALPKVTECGSSPDH